jgi:hypothetical protein
MEKYVSKVEKMLSRNSGFYGLRLEYLIAFMLLFNAFSWYFLCNVIIDNAEKIYAQGSFESLSIELAYPSSIIISAILASLLLTYVNKKHFFVSWTLVGIVSSLSSAFFSEPSLVTKVAITVFMGSSLGIGMPMCLDYFTKLVPIEKRGKTGGMTFLAIVISAVFFVMLVPELDPMINALILTAWRGWSLVILHFVSKHQEMFKGVVEKKKFYQGFPWNRTFFLYFATWFIFALATGFGANIVSFYGSSYEEYLKLIEPSVGGFSAVIAGAFCDWIGRKRVITFGFASLGAAYAVLGLTPPALATWLLFYIVDGIATGILWVTFIVVIWGEISDNGIEKSYAIGEAPYFLTGILSSLLAPFTYVIQRTSAFSLGALFLFVAVIPLMYVSETLPEKKIRDRELKQYIEHAKKTREKYT